MEQFGRAEVILDGSGYLEEAQEVVDVRLEPADLTWGWEGQGLMAEGAIRTYIYFQKEDGTVEGEGVEIPFHAVVAPPGSGPEEVQVRLDSVREEHRFDPEERSFSQTIRLELVAEAPLETEPLPPEEPDEALAERDGVLEGNEVDGPGEESGEPIAAEPARPTDLPEAVRLEDLIAEKEPEPAPQPEPAPEAERVAEPEPEPAPESMPGPRLEVEPAPGTGVAAEPAAPVAPEPEPLWKPEPEPEPVYEALRSSPGAGPGLEGISEPRSGQPALDDSVIVWKPFPEE